MKTKKLQNSFKDFLPQKYQDFKRSINELTANQAVVAELLRICCEESDVKAIQMAFERILGKPEKVVVIKRTLVRTIFPDATKKAELPVIDDRVQDEMAAVAVTEEKVVVEAADAPGFLLQQELDRIGEAAGNYAYEVIDNKNSHSVVEVMVANLYAIAMKGGNLGAIKLLFEYLDGAVADVVRLEGEQTVLVESWANEAPYEATQDEHGTWYVETEAVR